GAGFFGLITDMIKASKVFNTERGAYYLSSFLGSFLKVPVDVKKQSTFIKLWITKGFIVFACG
ncbi:MAG TPA: hypothetical protein PKL36_14425, partial [Agitococcus sp.]|nr:hypothetical protein [Agitococcus sp.]